MSLESCILLHRFPRQAYQLSVFNLRHPSVVRSSRYERRLNDRSHLVSSPPSINNCNAVLLDSLGTDLSYDFVLGPNAPDSKYYAYSTFVPMHSAGVPWLESDPCVMEFLRRPVSTGHTALAYPSASMPTTSRPRAIAALYATYHASVLSARTSTSPAMRPPPGYPPRPRAGPRHHDGARIICLRCAWIVAGCSRHEKAPGSRGLCSSNVL